MNSMTGFGAASAALRGLTLSVEVSGVNRKQAEIIVNLPRALSDLEPRVRQAATAAINRGRLTISVSLTENLSANSGNVFTLHTEKLHALCARLDEARSATGKDIQVNLEALSRFGIITNASEELPPSADVWEEALEASLRQALDAFCEMRAREGNNLCKDLLDRLDTLCQLRELMKQQAAEVPKRYREQLYKRLSDQGFTAALDDERVLKELALFADRCDVSEEMTRLSSHLEQFRALCLSEESVGRTLDFLCQEIFRELNTTGSKANSAELAQTVVRAKTELEKIREQVQNVE